MSGSAISLLNRLLVVDYLFTGVVNLFWIFLWIFRVNVQLVHRCKVLLAGTMVLFLFILIIRNQWLSLGFDWILVAGLLYQGSMNGFEILGFYLGIGVIPEGVVIVFLASSVKHHAFLILFVFHGRWVVDL